jgi:hypothetical protein
VAWGAVVLVSVFALAACTSPGGHPTTTKGSSVTASAQTAIVYLEQARRLIADIAQAVEPGAVVKQTVSDGPPQNCKSPLDSFRYFSIFRDFHVPSGKVGSSLLPALTTELKARGFSVSPIETGGYFNSVRGTKDDAVGIAAMGSPTSSLVRIGVDTQCGKPTAADENVDIAPSPSAT